MHRSEPEENQPQEQNSDIIFLSTLRTGSLVSLLQEWQELIFDGQEAFAMTHIQIHDILDELKERDLIDECWKWTMGFDEMDRDFTREYEDNALAMNESDGERPIAELSMSNEQKYDNIKPRNTTRTPKLTAFCGKMIPAKNAIPILHRPRERGHSKRLRNRCCIICGDIFQDNRDVFRHFNFCVKLNGNPHAACWYDHPSINVNTLPGSLMQ